MNQITSYVGALWPKQATPPTALWPVPLVMREAPRLAQIHTGPQNLSISGAKGHQGLFMSEVPWMIIILTAFKKCEVQVEHSVL
jgi:hypothetical protein